MKKDILTLFFWKNKTSFKNKDCIKICVIKMLAALFLGMIFTLALAPYHLWVIAIFSTMSLYLLLRATDSAKQGFWLGEAYGFGVWFVGAFWLFHSIHNYGGIPVWLAYILIFLMAVIMGLFHAVMAWIFVKFLSKQPLVFSGIWVLQEWLKTWLLSGFPWLFVGYAFTEVSWVNVLAPMTGVFGLSFLAVLFASSLAELFFYRYRFMLLAFCAWAILFGVSWFVPAWTTPTGERLSVSLVQGNISQDLKWDPDFLHQTLKIYESLSRSEWGRDMVVWPEAAIPLPFDMAYPFIDQMANEAKASKSAWVTGVPYREAFKDDATSDMYNSVVAFDEQNSIYRKQNLVPFGEYIPFAGLLNILPNLAGTQSIQSFRAGSPKQSTLPIKQQQMGVAICYEVAYPETTRKNAINSHFLLTVSNDAWFGASAGPMQHLQMVQMRSLETGRWFIRATNNGVTAVIDHRGRIVDSLPQFERSVLRAQVPSFTGQTPYIRFGSIPILLLSLLFVFAGLYQQYRKF